jgi:hypothetical protein
MFHVEHLAYDILKNGSIPKSSIQNTEFRIEYQE